MGVYAGYIRVSRVGPRSATLISPKLQAREIASFAEAHGHRVEMLKPELDQSGSKDDRPILQDAIGRIARGELDGIIVWNFARFTRSLESSISFLARIEDVGGQLHSTSQQIDPTTVSGRMSRNFLFSIAQAEREERAEGFEKAKADAIARGVWTAPHVPRGYRKREDRTIEPDPKVAPVVVEMFRRRGAGDSWRAISDYARDALGVPFDGPMVAAIVRNRVYLGEARQGEHLNLHAHEPLVDRATWEAAQLEQTKPARGERGEALLGGLLRCAGCSRRMGTSFRKGRRYYVCRRYHAAGRCPAPASISQELIEPYVVDGLFGHARQVAFTSGERTAAVEAAQRRLDEAEAELALYQETVRVSDVGAEHFASGMRSRVAEVDEARRALAAAKLAAPRVLPGTLEEIWPDLSVGERRQVLRSSFAVVWVRRLPYGAVADRVRIVAEGFAPTGLSVQGRPGGPLVGLDWAADIEGEIRVPGVEDGG